AVLVWSALRSRALCLTLSLPNSAGCCRPRRVHRGRGARVLPRAVVRERACPRGAGAAQHGRGGVLPGGRLRSAGGLTRGSVCAQDCGGEGVAHGGWAAGGRGARRGGRGGGGARRADKYEGTAAGAPARGARCGRRPGRRHDTDSNRPRSRSRTPSLEDLDAVDAHHRDDHFVRLDGEVRVPACTPPELPIHAHGARDPFSLNPLSFTLPEARTLTPPTHSQYVHISPSGPHRGVPRVVCHGSVCSCTPATVWRPHSTAGERERHRHGPRRRARGGERGGRIRRSGARRQSLRGCGKA
ncbi:hypothetical protein B0H14DRAFT_2981824, partial [Mycena olivaceomarginata]